MGGGMNVATYHGKTQNECAQLCNGNSRCQSYDWRPYSGYNCALNSVKCPHGNAQVPTSADGTEMAPGTTSGRPTDCFNNFYRRVASGKFQNRCGSMSYYKLLILQTQPR